MKSKKDIAAPQRATATQMTARNLRRFVRLNDFINLHLSFFEYTLMNNKAYASHFAKTEATFRLYPNVFQTYFKRLFKRCSKTMETIDVNYSKKIKTFTVNHTPPSTLGRFTV